MSPPGPASRPTSQWGGWCDDDGDDDGLLRVVVVVVMVQSRLQKQEYLHTVDNNRHLDRSAISTEDHESFSALLY